MMLTTKARYAIMAIIELAESSKSGPIKLEEISNKQGIPLSYLEQIFMKLKNAGIVLSVRGPGGGYSINNSLEKITLADIIDAVDENLKMTRCSDCKKHLPEGVKCRTHKLWKGLSSHIRNYFQEISIFDVVK